MQSFTFTFLAQNAGDWEEDDGARAADEDPEGEDEQGGRWGLPWLLSDARGQQHQVRAMYIHTTSLVVKIDGLVCFLL